MLTLGKIAEFTLELLGKDFSNLGIDGMVFTRLKNETEPFENYNLSDGQSDLSKGILEFKRFYNKHCLPSTSIDFLLDIPFFWRQGINFYTTFEKGEEKNSA